MPDYDYIGSSGDDRYEMQSSFPYTRVFYMTGLAGDDVLHGAFLHENYIWGGAGNDTLEGGARANTLDGGAGNDVLSAWGTSTYSELVGGVGHDRLTGGDGGNILNGGAGRDTMSGGDGGDTYYVDDLDDIVTETYVPYWDNDPNPTDIVISEISWTLGSNLEKLELVGTGRTKGTGNGLDNVIIGSDYSNILKGLGGDDELSGGKGRDRILGGNGNDTIKGGAGSDKIVGQVGDDLLVGGGGADKFIFKLSHGSDTIADFQAGTDVIKISGRSLEYSMLEFEQLGDDVLLSLNDLEVLVQNIDLDAIQNADNFVF